MFAGVIGGASLVGGALTVALYGYSVPALITGVAVVQALMAVMTARTPGRGQPRRWRWASRLGEATGWAGARLRAGATRDVVIGRRACAGVPLTMSDASVLSAAVTRRWGSPYPNRGTFRAANSPYS